MPDPTPTYDVLIFDLGEVIIDLTPDRVIEGFQAYSQRDLREVSTSMINSDYFLAYETGQLTDEEFMERVCRDLDTTIEPKEFTSVWNRMIGGIDVRKLDLLERLRSSYQLMLLSNTNAMHVEAFDQLVAEMKPGRKMEDFVDYAYYSNEIKLRKPDREIYTYVIETHDLDPTRTLFFDDRLENLQAAEEVGIRGHHIQRSEEVLEYFA